MHEPLILLYISTFIAVLVAHNGFSFDYMILISEVRRHKLDFNSFFDNIKFADTLVHLRKVATHLFSDLSFALTDIVLSLQLKNENYKPLQDTSLGLKNLSVHFLKERYEGYWIKLNYKY